MSLCGQALRLSAQAPHSMEEILSAWLHLDQDVELSVIPVSYLLDAVMLHTTMIID